MPVRQTFAQYLINKILPDGIQVDKQVDKGVMNGVLSQVANRYPDRYDRVVSDLKRLADHISTMEALTILDLWDRSNPALEAVVSLTGERVIQKLERLRLQDRIPQRLLTDNGPEITGRALDKWARKHGEYIEHMRPGKPTDNSLWKVSTVNCVMNS